MSRRRTLDGLGTITAVGGLWGGPLLTTLRDEPQTLPGTKPADYGLPSGLDLRSPTRAAWTLLKAAWADFEAHHRLRVDDRGEAYGTDDFTWDRWVRHLVDQLGYGTPTRVTGGLLVDDGDPDDPADTYPISHLWDDRVPLHLLAAGVPLDRTTGGVRGAARQSPHSLVQDYLNRTSRHLWGIVTNGLTLRLLRNNAALTRQAYVEFDLAAMFRDDNYHDFAVLWAALHASRFAADTPAECIAERWQSHAAETGVRALDALRAGVEAAVAELGQGMVEHPANQALRDRLATPKSEGGIDGNDLYRQLLYVAYRHVFLFAIEDRRLLHAPDADPQAVKVYREHFSTARWRDQARRHTGGSHPDAWEAHKVVARALGDPNGLPALGLPALLGRLWSAEATTDINDAVVTNRRYYAAVRHLAWVQREGTTHRVDYRNMGADELGAVYESLLELSASASATARRFELKQVTGSARKTTGSYYTPTSLIARVLDDTLEPVIARATDGKSGTDAAEAILSLTVCDPAMGSMHFGAAAAHRLAKHVAAHRTGNVEPAPEAYREALRDVVSRCIYGVDANPMAVDLAKMSLWLECHVPGKPLTFLDHHLKAGNALLGVGFDPELVAWRPGDKDPGGIPDAAFKALHGDDKQVVKDLKAANRARCAGQLTLDFSAAHPDPLPALAVEAARLAVLPDDDPGALAEKERLYLKFGESEGMYRERLRCDAWFATWMMRKTADQAKDPDRPLDVYYDCHGNGAPADTRSGVQTVIELSAQHRFFHWHLEFPDVAARGGFDVLLGNPPWERVKIQQDEWFASNGRPDIAEAKNAAARKKMIAALYTSDDPVDQQLASRWDKAQHTAASASNVLRNSGRFPLGGVGDVNLYGVFADHFLNAHNPDGAAGFICPVGLATGATYAPFFSHLLEDGRLVSFWTFENEDRIFPGVHHAQTFALVTFTSRDHPAHSVGFTGFIRHPDAIADPARRYTLSAADISAINPNTRTAPLFRRSADAAITAKVHRGAGVLVNETLPEDHPDHSPWHVGFLSMFHMANDSGLFLDDTWATEAGAERQGSLLLLKDGSRALPLYEGKMVWLLDHRSGTYEGQTQKQANLNAIPPTTDRQKSDPSFQPCPRYWVEEGHIDEQLEGRWAREWFLGWRDVTSAGNERTLIVSVLPRTAVGHKLPLMLPGGPPADVPVLLAALSSLAVDFRARTSASMSQFVVRQLPVGVAPDSQLPWSVRLLEFVAPRVAELTHTAWDLQGWGHDIGYPGAPYRWDPERRPTLRAELDAAFFHLYGLDRDETEWILDSFTALRRNEERTADKGGYGEFRTKRLVLERYDAMAKAADTGAPYETPLDPPPAHDSLRHPPQRLTPTKG